MGNILKKTHRAEDNENTYDNRHLITQSQYSILNEKKTNNREERISFTLQIENEDQQSKPKEYE